MLSIVAKFLVLAISSLLFLFLFWRRLKEDYTRNQIFTTAISALLALYIGSGIGILLPKRSPSAIFNSGGVWFWLGIVLSMAAGLLCIYKFRMRLYEVLEAFVLGLLFVAFSWSLILFWPASLLFLLLGIVFFVVDMRYKEFSWYKSGKMGLAGLTSLAVFFIIRSLVAIFNPNVISFMGRVDALFSAVIAFILFLAIYNLSENI